MSDEEFIERVIAGDAPPVVRIATIGIVQVDEHTELRFVKEPWGWRADLVVNQETEEVTAPPECFAPTEDVIEALNRAFLITVGDPLARLLLEDEGRS